MATKKKRVLDGESFAAIKKLHEIGLNTGQIHSILKWSRSTITRAILAEDYATYKALRQEEFERRSKPTKPVATQATDDYPSLLVERYLAIEQHITALEQHLQQIAKSLNRIEVSLAVHPDKHKRRWSILPDFSDGSK